MGKYTSIPVQVEAIRIVDNKDFIDFVSANSKMTYNYVGEFYVLNIGQGNIRANIGDWLVMEAPKENAKTFRVFTDSNFKKLFKRDIDDIDWAKVVSIFKKITSKSVRKVNDKAKRHIRARLKEGYTIEDFELAIKNCYEDDYHKENNHKYLTLEFISRPDKFERYVQQENPNKSNHNYQHPFK